MALINANTATFDGVDLTTIAGLTVLAINPYLPAKRKLTLYDLSRTSKATTTSSFYNKKTLIVRVGISQATRDLLETSLDSLWQVLQNTEKYLVLKQAGGTRQYSCTYSDAVVNAHGGSYVEIDLYFETSDHYGYDVNTSLLKQVSGYNSAQKTDQITVGGSAPWQAPKIVITLAALTGGTNKRLSFGNDATGQILTITRTFAAGDVLTIDCLAQSVKVGNTEIAFTGAFPLWAPGTGYVSYTDTLTTRTMNYTMTYQRRFI